MYTSIINVDGTLFEFMFKKSEEGNYDQEYTELFENINISKICKIGKTWMIKRKKDEEDLELNHLKSRKIKI